MRLQLGKCKHPSLRGLCQKHGALLSIYNLRPKPIDSSSLCASVSLSGGDEEMDRIIPGQVYQVSQGPALAIRRYLPSLLCGISKARWGAGMEGLSSFWGRRVAGSQHPNSRAFAHTLLLPSLLSTLPLTLSQKPFLISLAGVKMATIHSHSTLCLSTLVITCSFVNYLVNI